MRVDAEKNEQNGRRDRFSNNKNWAILRRTRIDELPQLWCIGRSYEFIGPRPERPEFDSALEKEISHYSLRYNIRPGKWLGPGQLSLRSICERFSE